MSENGWTTDADERGSYRGWTGYVVDPSGKRIAVGYCRLTKEDALERAWQALPAWAGFFRREKLISVRVDGEVSDAPLKGEETDPPSLTAWQRQVDQERLL